ncbi:MAG: hypothetical protein PHV71_01915 [Eubacteriales bacterium]|nr:hypothetical protein [Eubacteriales bacterium]MDD3200264.1 hypothetical protein [Eubacteriales bacterium]MDD4629342.1 hypothetical protein [Eubacteriales bacterium]
MITVHVYVKGYLKKYFDRESYSIELESKATLKDLYEKIDEDLGKNLPPSVWSHEKKSFRGPVVVKISGESIIDLDFKLQDGSDIILSRLLVGG